MSLVSSCAHDMLLVSKCLFKECERTNVQQVDLVAYWNFNVSLFVDVFWKNNHGQGIELFVFQYKENFVVTQYINGLKENLKISLETTDINTDFHMVFEPSCGDFLSFCHRGISEVGHWCWAIRSGSQSAFQLIPVVLGGVEVSPRCRPIKFPHTKPGKKAFLYKRGFVHSDVVTVKQRRIFSKQLPQSSKHTNVSYIVALKCPFPVVFIRCGIAQTSSW